MRAGEAKKFLGGLALCVVGSAQAQNLLVNSGFDTDITTGWIDYGSSAPADGTRNRSSDDVNADVASGSADFSVQTAGAQIGLAQCVAVTAGQTYDYYVRVKSLTGQTTDARALMEVAFFSSADCSTVPLGAEAMGAVIGAGYVLDSWAGIPGNAAPGTEGAAIAPAGAASAQVRLFVEQLSGTETHGARFDTAVFHDASTTPVSLFHFDVE